MVTCSQWTGEHFVQVAVEELVPQARRPDDGDEDSGPSVLLGPEARSAIGPSQRCNGRGRWAALFGRRWGERRGHDQGAVAVTAITPVAVVDGPPVAPGLVA